SDLECGAWSPLFESADKSAHSKLRFNETATTIHPGVGRFGGRTFSLDLSFSAAKSPTTECKCECSAGCVTFVFSNRPGLSNCNTSSGSSRFISGSGTGQRAATEAPHRHAFVPN